MTQDYTTTERAHLKKNEPKQCPTRQRGKPRRMFKDARALNLVRLPDGTPSKYIAIYCVRDDLQTKGVDYFETYATVV